MSLVNTRLDERCTDRGSAPWQCLGIPTEATHGGAREVAGPEQFRMDEFFRNVLATRDDSRAVVTDPHANFFGVELDVRTLLPGANAVVGRTRYDDWARRSVTDG
jgi:hypothetical protein